MFNGEQAIHDSISSEGINDAISGINDDVQIPEIPMEAILALRKQLRLLSGDWAAQLAKKMGIDVSKVYNITNNKVQGNKWRVDFVLQGTALKEELLGTHNQAAEIASSLIANP